jgi:hypothetical protein
MESREEQKKRMLDNIENPGAGGTHGREASRARLDTILVEEMVQHLAQLSAELHSASESSTKWAHALVQATWVLVFVTGVMALVAIVRGVWG